MIDIFEKGHPNDDRPRKAIEAAKEWLKNPTEENRKAAEAAWAAAAAARERIYSQCEEFILKRIGAEG